MDAYSTPQEASGELKNLGHSQEVDPEVDSEVDAQSHISAVFLGSGEFLTLGTDILFFVVFWYLQDAGHEVIHAPNRWNFTR